MAGSVLRLTILVVISSLPNYSVLQHPKSFIQNPFRLKTNFLRDFMMMREEIFPFSFSTSPAGFYTRPTPPSTPAPTPPPKQALSSTTSPSLAEYVLRHQLHPLESESSNVVKRRIARPVLENERVQNFILQKIGNEPAFKLQKPIALQNNETLTEDFVKIRNKNSTSISLSKSKESHPQNITLSEIKVKDLYASFDEKNNVTNYGNKLNTNHDSVTQGEKEISKTSFLGYVISTLTQLPIIGNVLRASVDPLYRPIVNRLQPENETIMRGENDMKNWCFGKLGCIQPTHDFFHPLYRPVNLPPYPREKIATIFTVHSRDDKKGYSFPAMVTEDILNSSFSSAKFTKIIIHGYLNDRHETWVWEMVRGLLTHGDYNVLTVDWSGGSYALYSQATANIRVVGLEIASFLDWAAKNLQLSLSTVHIIGHSLGAHTAGYVGEKVRALGRITGLDPAEPFFQYMPTTVRLDPSDAAFVDVIHTDTDSFFALTGPRGFGLQQAVGHIDFYPNGGEDQPGCNQLLARVPMTLMMEGEDIIEGINAAQTELINCDHVRSAKLFTDSLHSQCPYLSFPCSSYRKYKEGKCFNCGEDGQNCAFMGINANLWEPANKTNVRMFLDTHVAPNFCKYHYILTIDFADPTTSKGSLRGRLKISLINEDGNLEKFDLTPLSPLKFPRSGSKAFMLEHYEDLSRSQEALINWTFESDLLDPLTFCVIFCKADLTISSISILSIDTPRAASRVMKMRSGLIKGHSDEILNGGEIVMCHKNGEPIFKIPNEGTVKISVSPLCDSVRKNSQEANRRDSFSTKLAKVALSYYKG